MLFPILGIHNVSGLFAPVEAIFVERAEHSVLLVDGVEESADMISPGEIDPGELVLNVRSLPYITSVLPLEMSVAIDSMIMGGVSIRIRSPLKP